MEEEGRKKKKEFSLEEKRKLLNYAYTQLSTTWNTRFVLSKLEETDMPLKYCIDTNTWYQWSGVLWKEIDANEVINIISMLFETYFPLLIEDIPRPPKYLPQDKTTLEQLYSTKDFALEEVKDCDISTTEGQERKQNLIRCLHEIEDRIEEIEQTKTKRPEDTTRKICPLYQLYKDTKDRYYKWQNKCAFITWLESTRKHLMTIPDVMISDSTFNRNPDKLNLLNGTFDLKSMTFYDHRKEDYFTQIIPFEYEPEATCNLWDECLDVWFPGKADIKEYLQEVIGYALAGNMSQKNFWFFFGKKDTGKSTFVNILSRLLGAGSNTNNTEKSSSYMGFPPESVFASHSDEGAKSIKPYIHKRLLIATELTSTNRWNIPLLKRWTGGDTISARILGQNKNYDFYPQSTIIVTGNEKPTSKSYDDVFWDRVIIIPFENPVPKEIIEKHNSDKDKSTFYTAFDSEMSGIINWIIEGYRLFKENGLKKIPDYIQEMCAEYKNESNPLQRWEEDYVSRDTNSKTSKKQLWHSYINWCVENQISTQDRLNSKEFWSLCSRQYKFERKAGDTTDYIYNFHCHNSGSNNPIEDDYSNCQFTNHPRRKRDVPFT